MVSSLLLVVGSLRGEPGVVHGDKKLLLRMPSRLRPSVNKRELGMRNEFFSRLDERKVVEPAVDNSWARADEIFFAHLAFKKNGVSAL